MEEEICLVDNCTTKTILREIKHFQTLKKSRGNVTTIAGCNTMIMGSGRATLILPMGTKLLVENALMYPDSTCTLLSYKDIHRNVFHVEHITTRRMNIFSSLKKMDTSSKCLRKFLHYQLDCISYTSNPCNMLHIR
jgi:hypothetical protein